MKSAYKYLLTNRFNGILQIMFSLNDNRVNTLQLSHLSFFVLLEIKATDVRQHTMKNPVHYMINNRFIHGNLCKYFTGRNNINDRRML